VRALILGGAASVWADEAAARALGTFDATFAVNDIGAVYPGTVDVWASLHSAKFPAWVAEREANGHARALFYATNIDDLREPGRYFQSADGFMFDYATERCWPGTKYGGTSSLFAVKLALELGFDRIVLAGVPMCNTVPHFNHGKDWSVVHAYIPAWVNALPRLRDTTRSMSGWTRKVLGAPTAEFLAR
jgi:hypothetical protein